MSDISKTNQWTDDQIKDYLINHIQQSIKNDVGIAIDAYWKDWSNNKEQAGKGFFAIPRLLFPEIDGLGSYSTGKNKNNTFKNITFYFKNVMSKIDDRYAKFSSFITLIYRHGLLHQHTPKRIINNQGVEFGWWFAINSPNNPLEVQRKYHLRIKDQTLMIDMNVFCQDVVKSVEIATKMILKKYRQEFQESINEQNRLIPLTEILKRNDIVKQDFSFME